jgi:hypothetical protein
MGLFRPRTVSINQSTGQREGISHIFQILPAKKKRSTGQEKIRRYISGLPAIERSSEIYQPGRHRPYISNLPAAKRRKSTGCKKRGLPAREKTAVIYFKL